MLRVKRNRNISLALFYTNESILIEMYLGIADSGEPDGINLIGLQILEDPRFRYV